MVPALAGTDFPYRDWPCLAGAIKTAGGEVPRVSAAVTWRDVLGRWQMRWGFGRDRYRIRPGLYAIGTPTPLLPSWSPPTTR